MFTILISACLFVLFVYCLFTAVVADDIPAGQKVVWVLVLLFLPLIGMAIYLIVRHPWSQPIEPPSEPPAKA